MIANKAIDFIDNNIPLLEKDGRQRSHKIIDIYYLIRRTLLQSIKFDFSHGEIEGEYEIVYSKLPFNKCYFEFSVQDKGTYGYLLEQVDDNEIVVQMIQDSKMGFEPQMIMFKFMNKPEGIMMGHRHTIENNLYTERESKEACNNAASAIFAALSIINCSNVELVDNTPSNFKQSRVKKNKAPLFEFKTLHIKQNTKKNIQKGNGTHKSPRVHLRRGHIRRLPTGTTTWVQPCMVGSADGIVHKDYTVH